MMAMATLTLAITSGIQRRTLTLSNGEVIWDMAGNVYDWTADQITGGQPGITGEAAYAWKEWTAVTAAGSLAINATPGGTGLSGASAWTESTNGIGKLCSYVSESAQRGFVRAGVWGQLRRCGRSGLDFEQRPQRHDLVIMKSSSFLLVRLQQVLAKMYLRFVAARQLNMNVGIVLLVAFIIKNYN